MCYIINENVEKYWFWQPVCDPSSALCLQHRGHQADVCVWWLRWWTTWQRSHSQMRGAPWASPPIFLREMPWLLSDWVLVWGPSPAISSWGCLCSDSEVWGIRTELCRHFFNVFIMSVQCCLNVQSSCDQGNFVYIFITQHWRGTLRDNNVFASICTISLNKIIYNNMYKVCLNCLTWMMADCIFSKDFVLLTVHCGQNQQCCFFSE